MRVTVRLFARLREAAGETAWTVELPAHATVADVWQAAVATYEVLAPFGASISAAVNADFARMSTAVHDGDEVAFLPPVSGGGTQPRWRQKLKRAMPARPSDSEGPRERQWGSGVPTARACWGSAGRSPRDKR